MMAESKILKAMMKNQQQQEEPGVDASASSHRVERVETHLLQNAIEKSKRERIEKDIPNPFVSEPKDHQDLLEIPKPQANLSALRNPNPWSVEQLAERKIIHATMANRQILNAYRELRIKLTERSHASNIAVLIASAANRDSSTITALNLAASFALDQSASALLIDCDPYNSQLQYYVNTPMAAGITDYLADFSLPISEIIYPSGIDRLNVIAPGSIHSSAVEQFNSDRMKQLMIDARTRYPDRFIVLNAPSINANTEARVLSRYVDQAVISVPYGQCSPGQIEGAIEAMGNEKFAGLVYQQ